MDANDFSCLVPLEKQSRRKRKQKFSQLECLENIAHGRKKYQKREEERETKKRTVFNLIIFFKSSFFFL